MAELISLKDSNNNVGIIKGLSDADVVALDNAEIIMNSTPDLDGLGDRYIICDIEPGGVEDDKVLIFTRKTKTVTVTVASIRYMDRV